MISDIRVARSSVGKFAVHSLAVRSQLVNWYIFFLIKRLQKIPVKQEKQNQCQADASNPRKLYGKTQLAAAFLAKRNGEAEAKPAGYGCGSHDDRNDPSQNAQESFVARGSDHTQKQAKRRSAYINQG